MRVHVYVCNICLRNVTLFQEQRSNNINKHLFNTLTIFDYLTSLESVRIQCWIISGKMLKTDRPFMTNHQRTCLFCRNCLSPSKFKRNQMSNI